MPGADQTDTAGAHRFRYPKKFEIYRLEALGDDPYDDESEAREKFESGRSVSVLPAGDEVPWSLTVAANTYPFAGTHRYSLTWYSPSRTPVRQVTWESRGEALVCRDSIDVFYPEGDPGRRLPFVQVITVEQTFAVDGVLQVMMTSPIEDERVVEVVGVDDAALRIAAPAFGEWDELLAASAPTTEARFGLDTLDTSRAFFDRCVAKGAAAVSDAAWRVPFDDRGVFDAVKRIVDRAESDAVVLDRGPARIFPLAAQGGAQRRYGRHPDEERRRVERFADRIRGVFEHHHGAQIPVDLMRRGTDTLAAYAASLRAAGAASAVWWGIGSAGAVLVTTGDARDGDLTLAVHVVPMSWVSDRRARPDGERARLSWSIDDVGR